MNGIERMKLVKAMEYIARQINDESIFYGWFILGPGDGTFEYGDLNVTEDDIDGYYCGGDGWSQEEADANFSYLMRLFLNRMYNASKSGGLYCDGVVSE